MSVETATYINDLQPANPPSGDPRSQGDDHLRLTKQVLQNQFPRATRPRPIEIGIAGITTNFTILSTHDQSTLLVDTSAGVVTLTLPNLLSSDNGWEIAVQKISTSANPIFIVPPSGNLLTGGLLLPKARRSVPGVTFRIFWNSSSFNVERVCTLPIGSMIDYAGASLPPGYEWPNGQTLASASTNYPEYNSVIGSGITLDFRGRVAVTLDNLGGSGAGRVTTAGSGVDGTTLGASGGAQNITMVRANLPNTNISMTAGNGGITDPGHVHTQAASPAGGAPGGLLQQNVSGVYVSTGANTFSNTTGISAQFNLNGNVTQTAMIVMQPSLVCSKILVVE